MKEPDAILAPADAARLLGVHVRSLERWRVTGDGPAFVRIGLRRVGYRVSDIEAWLDARAFPHRAAELAGKVAA
ncbi:helix-turn-helix transcriptional regulator [Falsiroseomonas oryziterrae]|uniref:helix-turn-helix transcriptional regulator n=1 Tax=Falsiroseomonas oryziterrae TaxID=2911368 RepID=UPI001F2C6D9E|nr:helix-turn-helix domain-containing protein [Roseomonas sp. NPKOSM-4]